jgi:hypothetical protein
MSGLTNYNVKDPYGNFIDLSYIFMPRTGYQLLTNLKSNGIDIGPLFQPLIIVRDLSTNAIVQPAAKDLSYVYYLFDTVGTNTNGYLITNGNYGSVHCVAIGGGGGGGRGSNNYGGGGGGAGAIIKETLSGLSTSSTIYINIGLGGVGSILTTAQGGSGANTDISFNSTKIIAGGGGGGGCSAGTTTGRNGSNYSSGGGGSNGGNGGIGLTNGGAGGITAPAGGGGGGGASNEGLNGGRLNSSVAILGEGGPGLSINSKLTGSTAFSTIYCVGGGGGGLINGNNTNGQSALTYGSGGAGGSGGTNGTNGYQGAVFLAFDYKPIVDNVII